jgi:Carboxypeptidase regulatory-like domain
LDAASSFGLGWMSGLRDGAPVRYLVVILAACGASQHPVRTHEGAIAGLARDHDSGDPVAKAKIHVRPQGQIEPLETVTSSEGVFGIDHLKPGKYSLIALFAGQQVDVENIEVKAGEPTIIDVMFTLGRPDPVHVDFGDPAEGEIDRFHPSHHRTTAMIEGTVNDSSTHERVAGAVVTAVGPEGPEAALQAVSDDQGRYRFDPVEPGTYVVSAYYSIGGRGQIEVRRSEIHIDPAEGVIVPLWVEIARRN